MKKEIKLESFLQTMHNDIEKKINEIITDETILLILKGGKRLRPLLAYIVFNACAKETISQDQHQKFLERAVGLELAHSASLVHDDIIDGDLERRGRTAFYITSGVDNAILIGHKMVIIGFDIALSHGDKFAKIYIDAWRETLNGQMKEVSLNSENINITNVSVKSKLFQIYSDIINLKTATLFSLSCKTAAISIDASDKLSDLFAEYGREVGMAYQLADDLVDLCKGEMIGSVFIPFLLKLEKKSIKNDIIKKKIKNNLSEIKQLFLDEIKNHLEKAQQISNKSIVPNNQYKQFLNNMPLYVINKMLTEVNITI